jgi:hypothetical protein
VSGVVAVFDRACELAMANGAENINLDAGCHELAVDEDWWLAINPHDRPRRCSRGLVIKPLQIYFEWRGRTAGFSKEVNEARLLVALERALNRKGTLSP